ncbi:hypothetical protein C1H76_2500 [Elsinoe australis]|uniref:gamma-glutamylcyclotransferase n=1 Tax=Elsinoe australis TaxID=40998 RepID=A0A4U7BBN0_9PEZI|nr:hypothetical protein C1H76_2500 [Elsinoe australis]
MSASDRALLSEARIEGQLLHTLSRTETSQLGEELPQIPESRRKESRSEPVTVDQAASDTVLYLAYGSNLCDETFLGKRGIRPLRSLNVLVPDLRLTFDLPGLPYSEPCFANSARRYHKGSQFPTNDRQEAKHTVSSTSDKDYHKNHWKKGLVGVVYEVTKADYRTIIATEGGGSAYNDILINCYPLSNDQKELVPEVPTTTPFKTHTLFAPANPEEGLVKTKDAPLRRPDPAYAQASARYLKLITDGAKQRKLPFEYQRYLDDLRPYTITTQQQRIGMFVFMMLWTPFLTLVFSLSRMLADENGKAPAWVAWLSAAIFRSMWTSYDFMFKPIFGDGERTIEDDEGNDSTKAPLLSEKMTSSPRLTEKSIELPK